MKICGQEMKVTLTIYGRERTFSEGELISILEKYFTNERASATKVKQGPTEDQWFDVDPQAIDQNLFQREREDIRQEYVRKLILEALAEAKNHPEKYGEKFKTMMPNKAWLSKTVEELKQMAYELGDHNADWVEQALEWAQRICNGESWESICNDADTADWYRLIIWKNGDARIVGGSRISNSFTPAGKILSDNYLNTSRLSRTVPLVVLY